MRVSMIALPILSAVFFGGAVLIGHSLTEWIHPSGLRFAVRFAAVLGVMVGFFEAALRPAPSKPQTGGEEG